MSAGEQKFDIVVAGAGGAGLTTALIAAVLGAKVLVVERTPMLGGVTATSAGSVWIPGSKHDRSVDDNKSRIWAKDYMLASIGPHADEELITAFLEWGPKAISLLESETEVRFRPYPHHPDYLADLPGATLSGRALEPLPFDGRKLGAAFGRIRPPIPEFTILGGMMVDRTDIGNLLKMLRSPTAFAYATSIVARHASDRLRYSRGTRLVMGNALIGRLLYSLIARDVTIWTDAIISEIERDSESKMRVTVSRDGRETLVRAGAGVVLATGGINRDPQLRLSLPTGAGILTPGPNLAEMSGPSGQRLAVGFGVPLKPATAEGLFWAPVSTQRRKDGSEAIFPHFVFDRAKPGTFVVNELGQRYLNESLSYHRFGLAMIDEHSRRPRAATYLIADAQAVRQYGLGTVRPGGIGLTGALARGYLVKAGTLPQLAAKIGIAAAALDGTAVKLNQFARTGIDTDFHRGENSYERNLGDPNVGPNPTLRTLGSGPFYSLRLFPGDIGASAGLVTDKFGRVMAGDEPIDGLYAVGNDMNSVMGGSYPAPGITLGAAIAFSYAVACHLTGRVV